MAASVRPGRPRVPGAGASAPSDRGSRCVGVAARARSGPRRCDLAGSGGHCGPRSPWRWTRARRHRLREPRARSPREAGGDAAGLLDRRAEGLRAGDDEQRHVRHRAGLGERPAGAGPARAAPYYVASGGGRGIEWAEGAGRLGIRCRRGLRQPLLGRRPWRPGQRGLLAQRRRVRGRAEHPRTGLFLLQGDLLEPQERRAIAGERGAHGSGEPPPDGWLRVARGEDGEQLRSGDAAARPVTVRRGHRTLERRAGEPLDEPGEIAHRVRGEAPAECSTAQLAQDARRRGEGRAVERVHAAEVDRRLQ